MGWIQIQGLLETYHTLYRIKYAYGFVVFVLLWLCHPLLVDVIDLFIHILQGWFTGIGAMIAQVPVKYFIKGYG